MKSILLLGLILIGFAVGSSIRGAKPFNEMGPIRIAFFMIVGELNKSVA